MIQTQSYMLWLDYCEKKYQAFQPFINLEINLEVSEKFLPPLLSKMLLWLASAEAFKSADPEFQASEKLHCKVLALGQSIIFCSQNKVIPLLRLGLAAQFHPDYGKREIIDTLNSHGFCISYDQLCSFITDLSKDELSRVQEDIYVLHDLIPN